MNIFIQGFLLQASLIFALGAQNIFVMESGLHKRRHMVVALVCSICDLFLVLVGVLGVSTVFSKVPALKIGIGVLGVAFLIYYGFLKLKESFSTITISVDSQQPTKTLKQVILLTLGFSLLNPHVYLDTIVLIGGYSSKFETIREKFLFGMGAGSFSAIWFFGLALMASSFSQLLKNKKAMRIISFISGIILLTLSWKLGSDVLDWLST